jgi:hypothetical protein
MLMSHHARSSSPSCLPLRATHTTSRSKRHSTGGFSPSRWWPPCVSARCSSPASAPCSVPGSGREVATRRSPQCRTPRERPGARGIRARARRAVGTQVLARARRTPRTPERPGPREERATPGPPQAARWLRARQAPRATRESVIRVPAIRATVETVEQALVGVVPPVVVPRLPARARVRPEGKQGPRRPAARKRDRVPGARRALAREPGQAAVVLAQRRVAVSLAVVRMARRRSPAVQRPPSPDQLIGPPPLSPDARSRAVRDARP